VVCQEIGLNSLNYNAKHDSMIDSAVALLEHSAKLQVTHYQLQSSNHVKVHLQTSHPLESPKQVVLYRVQLQVSKFSKVEKPSVETAELQATL